MGLQASFHAPGGGADFLGMRKGRSGATEIVYDDGVARRMVWRVTAAKPDEERISEAMRVAVGSSRVVTTLYDELTKRAIAIERISL
jgi:hypothetical protein